MVIFWRCGERYAITCSYCWQFQKILLSFNKNTFYVTIYLIFIFLGFFLWLNRHSLSPILSFIFRWSRGVSMYDVRWCTEVYIMLWCPWCIVRVPRVGPPLHQGLLGFWQFSEAGRRNIACSVICPLHYQSTWFVLTNRSEASHYREVYEDGNFFLFQIFGISAKSTVSGASFAKPFSYS